MQRILTRKFTYPEERSGLEIKALFEGAIRVEISGKVRGVCRDPNDNYLLECARNTRATFILTGDNDLLSIGSFEGTRIVTPRQYLEQRTGSLS